MALIDDLIEQRWLKTPQIISAFKKIKRADFLPEDIKDLAEENMALTIDHGQTISQPLTVAFMFELLEPKEGQKILDIGSGSGWTTALLSEIVGEKGKITSLEIVPELSEFGKNNADKYGFVSQGRAEFLCVDGSKGYEKDAPYDRILVSASGDKIPEEWKKQLKEGGRIVAPVKNSIWLLVKGPDGEFTEKEYSGFVFVPLL